LAGDLNLPESWFRDAIFHDPELVIGPCREAGRTPPDEKWMAWQTEFDLDTGRIDVLLVSSHGRPAIVETKLSYNPQKRREVVAQVLDYAVALQEIPRLELPKFPTSEDAPNADDLEDCLRAGKFLLIVAGDSLDPRALRLSQALLAGHLTSEWDLAMVDMNLYQSVAESAELLIVPELRGVLVAETRQVVRVQIEGETPRARIVVEHLPAAESVSTAVRPKLASVEDFVARVRQRAPSAGGVAARIVQRFQQAENASQGRLVLGLQTATANLYWNSGGALRRLFTLSERGRFRVWVGYVLRDGRTDLAQVVREMSRPIVTIAPEEGSGALFVDEKNVDAILLVIDAVSKAVVQASVDWTGNSSLTPEPAWPSDERPGE
jgi:hypothetical protein